MNEWGDYCPLDVTYKWGVPDWRDPAAYGNTKLWSLDRWRWEFTRRREDYREDYSRLALRSYVEQCEIAASMRARSVHWPRVRAPIEPSFTAHADDPWKYGRLGLLNPAIGEHQDDVLRPLSGCGEGPRFVEGHGTRREQGGEPNASISLGQGTIGACFDLDKPIRPQIIAAERALKIWQLKRHGRKVQRRARKDLWLRYLRVLDAKADGLKPLEIATTVLPAMGSEDDRAAPAEDTLDQAIDTQFNFPF